MFPADSRKHPDAPAITDLGTIVIDIEPMVRRLLSDCVELQISLSPEPMPVLVDVAQIEVLIMNLIINAQDAMPEGGTLSITTAKEITFPGTPEDHTTAKSYSVLEVSDTGQGIAPEVQGRIFEPFFTTKSLGKGTGLGLSTVYGIVERAGGFIQLESEQSEGTRFRVYLPEADTVPGLISTPSGAVPQRGHETILLAEDEAGIRAMTRAYLEGLGYRVLEAVDGSEAIRLSREYQGVIDLVLTDVLMPHMRGDSAVNVMRAQRPELKALFISGYDQLADQPLDILFKPFEFPELGRRVRAALDATSPNGDSQR